MRVLIKAWPYAAHTCIFNEAGLAAPENIPAVCFTHTFLTPDFDLSEYTFVLQFQSVPLVREKLESGRVGEKVPTHLFSDLAGIFGIHFRQISELPRLLAFVKIPLVRLLYLHHFNLDRPLRSDLDRKTREFQTHRPTLLFSIIIGSCVCVL